MSRLPPTSAHSRQFWSESGATIVPPKRAEWQTGRVRTDRLVLWDIDLTLLDVRGFGTRWYDRALTRVADRRLQRMPDTAGRTERAIASDVLRNHGVSVNETALLAMFEALTNAVADSRAEIAQEGSALPGASDALGTLAASGVVQTLVTGNLRAVAEHKLTAFQLHRHVDFEIGGFGADSEHRHELIADAVGKAVDKHDTGFAAQAVTVIGDTPHDVTGALRFGAQAIGVTTGHSDANELRAAGARTVLRDLTELRLDHL